MILLTQQNHVLIVLLELYVDLCMKTEGMKMDETTTYEPETTLFLRCMCCCHALTITPITDEDDKIEFGERAITIHTWDAGGSIKPIWQRIKIAYRLLLYGDIHGDHVIISNRQINELIKFLKYIEARGNK